MFTSHVLSLFKVLASLFNNHFLCWRILLLKVFEIFVFVLTDCLFYFSLCGILGDFLTIISRLKKIDVDVYFID